MSEKPKRRWFRFRLLTAVLAMLLLATAVQLNLSGQFNPVGIFVYDEYSWDSWKDFDAVHVPPRQRVIVAEPHDDYSGYGLSFRKLIPGDSKRGTVQVCDEFLNVHWIVFDNGRILDPDIDSTIDWSDTQDCIIYLNFIEVPS